MTTPREVLRASREAERKEHDHDRVLPGREHDQQVRPEGYTSSIATYMIRFVSGQWARTRLSDSAGPTRTSRTRHRGLPPRHEWRCETGDPTRCFRPSLSTMEGTRPDASGGLGSSGAGRGGAVVFERHAEMLPSGPSPPPRRLVSGRSTNMRTGRASRRMPWSVDLFGVAAAWPWSGCVCCVLCRANSL